MDMNSYHSIVMVAYNGGLTIDPNIDEGDYYPANTGALLAHDLIEHRHGIDSIGSIEDELQAIGAGWITRGQWGDYIRGRNNSICPYVMAASDVLNLFELCVNVGEYIKTIPSIKEVEGLENHLWHEDMNLILAEFRGQVKKEYPDASKDTIDQFSNAALYYMLQGVDSLVAELGDRFRGNNIFWCIAQEYDSLLKTDGLSEGIEYRIEYGEKEGESFCKINIVKWYDGDHIDDAENDS